jgi:N-acetylmuramoyl-L-alanine amidase CwlA
MGNQLLNSMVRGFGMTLGRKAANSVTRPSQTRVVNSEPTFSKRQMELIQEYETIRNGIYKILEETELYYKNGKITEGEYNILKSQANDQLIETNQEIDKLKSVSQSSGSVLKTLLILFIIGSVLYGMFS